VVLPIDGFGEVNLGNSQMHALNNVEARRFLRQERAGEHINQRSENRVVRTYFPPQVCSRQAEETAHARFLD
jgi:hypothetical protein